MMLAGYSAADFVGQLIGPQYRTGACRMVRIPRPDLPQVFVVADDRRGVIERDPVAAVEMHVRFGDDDHRRAVDAEHLVTDPNRTHCGPTVGCCQWRG